MKTIEINTPQSVVISYRLAGLGERLLAFTIDLVIVVIACLIAFLISSIVFDNANRDIIIIICFVIPLSTYHLISELISNGRSLGKRILQIKVIKINGEKASAFDFLIRWVFRLIEILFSLGTIAVILISSSSRSQRIGDIISGMIVIKSNIDGEYQAHWIKNRKPNPDYIPQYPEIKALSEEDMLVVKQTVDRYFLYPNNGHKEALELLTKKIEEQLHLKAPQNKIKFLNQLIKDYVYLTR
jgi:uncharacterized RDD family membrane protein YckC